MGGKDRDEETGKFTETYPPSDFLEALKKLESAGTSEIADFVGCDRRTAYLKLQSLEEEGRISSKKVGNSLLWDSSE